jgi:hypothetical protein
MKKIKQQKVVYPKISFCATTIDWTFGGILNIEVRADAGCSFCVAWGDGKQDRYVSRGATLSLEHNYFPGVIIPENGISFYVEIFSNEENCRIVEFGLYNIEMVVTELNLTHCVELEALLCPMMYEPITLDLSKNTALRYLDCNQAKLSELDLSNNTELVELNCYWNDIKTLDLSNNTKLRVLDCTQNKMSVLLIWHGSQLRNASFVEGNNIDAYAVNEIMDIIEANPPVEDSELYYSDHYPIMSKWINLEDTGLKIQNINK